MAETTGGPAIVVSSTTPDAPHDDPPVTRSMGSPQLRRDSPPDHSPIADRDGMALTVHTTDVLTVTPPLNRQEQRYLRGLSRDAGGAIRRPGIFCPWEPADDGATLHVFEEWGTKQPLAEWAAYLASHLLGPDSPRLHGRLLKGFTYDHVLTGRVEVEGQAAGDRWTLVAGQDGVAVERRHMPCASCWTSALLSARPTEAYRFVHPVREANLIDGRLPRFDHRAMEVECRSRTWAPVGATRRDVLWPPAPRWLDWWIDTDVHPDALPFGWGDDAAEDTPPDVGEVDPWRTAEQAVPLAEVIPIAPRGGRGAGRRPGAA
jgi:hypothetical protein